ncbi:MAG TPA: DUF4397 domain-containing protein [Gemmatimonadales bacterium]|nr:DUF4397 domain-containing protein [Gemmatimonadales bacterium]
MGRLRTIVATLAAGLAVAACNDSTNPAANSAQLRVVQAVPASPTLDVLLDGGVLVQDLAAGSFVPYRLVTAGARKVDVTTSDGTPVASTTATLLDQSSYTLLIAGTVGAVDVKLFTDDIQLPPTDKTKLHVVQASPAEGTVDVYVTAPGADLTTATPTFAGVTFETSTDTRIIPAGSYQVRVTPAGSKIADIDAGTLMFNSGQVQTVFVVDKTGGGKPGTVAVVLDNF